MGIRPYFALILTVAVLFASVLTGTAAASAATMPGHDMAMMEMGHCASPPSGHDEGKPMPKQCCIAMCMAAVAIAPPAPAELPMLREAPATYAVPTGHKAYLGEIATPPPRFA